jgi:hypothetical protein
MKACELMRVPAWEGSIVLGWDWGIPVIHPGMNEHGICIQTDLARATVVMCTVLAFSASVIPLQRNPARVNFIELIINRVETH